MCITDNTLCDKNCVYFRGEIIVAKPLDYEKQMLYSLKVVASDGKTVSKYN